MYKKIFKFLKLETILNGFFNDLELSLIPCIRKMYLDFKSLFIYF